MDSKEVKETTPELLAELSEGGAKEVKELVIKQGNKEHKAIIVMDFALYRKAYALFMSPKISKKPGEKAPEVDIETDLAAAGDKLLFMGWHSGDESIKKVLKLRAKACNSLGNWLLEISADDEDLQDDSSEKKT